MQTYVTNAATVLIFGIFCPLPLARRSASESLTRFDAQKWDESSLATAQKDPPQSKRSLERSAAASADAAPAAAREAAAAAAIADMLQKFPKLGAEVMAGAGEMYVVHASSYTHAHQVDEHMESVACPLENVPDGWLKVVFAGDPETIRKAGQYAKTRYFGRDNYFLPTNQIYLEIMPSGISKAAGMEELCHILNENIKKTIVIGDYYNDLEIMKKAGYSVAVANAPSEVKAAANEVTNCDCTGGAVGEFLYKLISKVEGV